MGCCNKRRRVAIPQHSECKTLEYDGAGTRLWPRMTNDGVVVTIRTEAHGFVELGSFLGTFNCENSVARMLQRYLPDISRLATEKPRVLRSYGRTGISLTELLRLAAPPRRSRKYDSKKKKSRIRTYPS